VETPNFKLQTSMKRPGTFALGEEGLFLVIFGSS